MGQLRAVDWGRDPKAQTSGDHRSHCGRAAERESSAATDELELTVLVDHEVATYRVELIRGGEVVSVLQSTVRR